MNIIHMAKEMGQDIPIPIYAGTYLRDYRCAGGKVLVDDIDAVLGMILKAHIETATLTPDSLTENEDNSMTMTTTLCSDSGITVTYKHNTSAKLNAQVKDVNVIVPNKVVEVMFTDGTKEKAVCREPDVFSLEQAIAICIGKKIMGGSSAYNNAIKRGLKVYDDKLNKEWRDKAEQERIANKRAKRIAYKKRKAAEKEQAEKERQIEIQKEAYIRAMTEIRNVSAN